MIALKHSQKPNNGTLLLALRLNTHNYERPHLMAT